MHVSACLRLPCPFEWSSTSTLLSINARHASNSQADLACFGAAVGGGQSAQAGAVQRLAALKAGPLLPAGRRAVRGFSP